MTAPDGGSPPRDLRVEFARSPDGVDPESAPRFSWRVSGDARGARQTASRVVVASAPDRLPEDPDVWDSGVVEGSAVRVAYGGPPLAADRTYYWSVRVWTDGDPGPFAEPRQFGTALGGEGDWAGDWITHAPAGGDADGYRSEWRRPATEPTEWVQVDLGERVAVDAVTLHPAVPFDGPETPDGVAASAVYAAGDADGLAADGPAGFGFPDSYRIAVGDDPDMADATVVADRTGAENPGAEPRRHAVDADAVGRYVRVTATDCYTFDPADPPERPAQRKVDALREAADPWAVFALAGLTVRAGGEDAATGCPVTASSSAESPTWGRANLVDGAGSRVGATAPLLREDLHLSKPVARARAHVVTLGYGQLHVNGERVGAARDPPWTDYGERVLYATHDVTDHLREGENAVGLSLGRGWFSKNALDWTGFGSPRGRLHLTVEFADGTTRTVGTGPDWRAATGPVRANDVYDGETYDAREERPGWDRPGFDCGDWEPAAVVPGPGGDLRPQRVESMAVVDAVDPVDSWPVEDGRVFDFGENLTGHVELALREPDRGEAVTVTHAEATDEAGDLLTVDLRSAAATDAYVPRGDDAERYEPRFTYHGFRYAKVAGADDPSVTAKVVHTAMDRAGTFDCADDALRRVQANAVRGLRGTTHAVPEDCPQRDERFGWTGDGHIAARALQYNFDAARFHPKWVRDHDDAQTRGGALPATIPWGFGGLPADPTWTITRVLVPWHCYRHYGDRRVLREHYDAMCRYVEFWDDVAAANGDLLPAEYGDYGDWLAFENSEGPRGLPHDLFNTAYHYHVTATLSKVATALDRSGDADRYADRASSVAAAFDDRFLDSAAGEYRPGTQSAQAVPLYVGLVDDDRAADVAAALAEKVREAGGLRTGFLGTRSMLFALAEHGYPELAFEVVRSPDRPGWVYMAEQGATTMWERWDSDDRVGSGMNSLNHSPLTFVSEWFYEVLAGIRPAEPGFAHATVAPAVVDGLAWAGATVETPRGPLAARWDRDPEPERAGLELSVTVPWNATATVRVPGAADATVREGETLLWDGAARDLPDGVTGVAGRDGDVAVEVGAGDYRFVVE